MKIKRLPLWATLAASGFLLIAASSNSVVGGLRAHGPLLQSLQDQKNPRPGASPQTSIPPVVKAPSNLVVSPFFRISQASAVSADRAARVAEATYNPDDNEYLVGGQRDGVTVARGLTVGYGRRIKTATNHLNAITVGISY